MQTQTNTDFTSATSGNKDVRAKIIVKLRALLAKTTDKGCTEAEATAAAEKASELMEEYDLSYTDVEQVRDERYGKRARPFAGGSGRRRTHHEVSMVHRAIQEYCDCKAWYSGSELVFFGSEADTETAHNLSDLIRGAMDREWASYLNSPQREKGVHGRSLRSSFLLGMALRLSQRLREIKALREANVNKVAATTGQTNTGGRALILVAKKQIVEERFAALGMKLGSARGGRRANGSSSAYRAGEAAGNRVGLNPGVGGNRKAIAG